MKNARRNALLALLLLASGTAIQGCVAVKASERGYLADPIMEREDHFSKQTLAQKFFSSREGSIGGAGGIGGGCGCAK